MPSIAPHVRLARHYSVDPSTQCWNWTGSLSTQGEYPTFTDADGRIVYAYRFVYEQAYGPIPDGYQIHHKCQNRLCINPAHLEALTAEEHRAAHVSERAARYIARLPWVAALVRSGWTTQGIKAGLNVPAYLITEVRRAIRRNDAQQVTPSALPVAA